MLKAKSHLFIVVILFSLVFVSAITATIGNSRMVLNADVNEVVERYILVRNTNDVSVRIELEASGDLENYTKIKDNNFTLQPGDEKKAYFTIKSPKAGTTETKIKVLFVPESGSAVGLGSTVTFIAGGSSSDSTSDSTTDSTSEDVVDDSTVSSNSESTFKLPSLSVSPITLLTIFTAVLVIVFVVLMIFLSKKKKKSGDRRKR